MSNFDAQVITQFFDDQRLKFSGIIFGEIWFMSADVASAFDVDISLKRGEYMKETFDEMTMSFLYKGGMLHVDDISMTRGESMGFQVSGIVPISTTHQDSTQISIQSTFRGLSMPMVHRFIPRFYKLSGQASGTLELSGSMDNTVFSFDTGIKNAQFDRIHLGTVNGKGQYTGRRLIIDKAESRNKDEIIIINEDPPFGKSPSLLFLFISPLGSLKTLKVILSAVLFLGSDLVSNKCIESIMDTPEPTSIPKVLENLLSKF